MRETKRCPYCGEEILAVAKKCKHCGEWFEASESQKQELDPEVSVQGNLDDTSVLYCRKCGRPNSVDSESCTYCNATDPFYFRSLKTKKRIREWGGSILIIVLVILCAIVVISAFDLDRRFTKIFSLVTLFVIFPLHKSLFVNKLVRQDRDNIGDELKKHIEKYNESQTYSRWFNKTESLLDQ